MRSDVLEQLQPFRAHTEFSGGKTGRIAARPGEALDETDGDRIRERGEHDRDGARHLSQRHDELAGRHKNDVWGQRYQFLGKLAISLDIARSPTNIDPQVAANSPPSLLQTLEECRETGLPFRIVGGQVHEHADAPHPRCLLSARRKWPRHRAADDRDEFAPFHSIVSPALGPGGFLSRWTCQHLSSFDRKDSTAL